MTQASPAVRVVGIFLVLAVLVIFILGGSNERLLSMSAWTFLWIGCGAFLLVALIVGIALRKFRGAA